MEQNSRTRNSLINLFTGFGGQLLTIFLSFIVRTVFIKTLGKSYLGINGLFSNILTMLSLTELGLDTAINFKLYKPLSEHDEKRVRLLMKFYRQAYAVIGGVILLLGLCLIPLLPRLINDYDSLESLGIDATVVFLLYLAQSVSSYMFFASRSAVVKADQKQYLLDVVDYLINIALSVSQIITLICFSNFILYTALTIVWGIIKNLTEAVIAKKYYGYAFCTEKDSLSINEIKEIFKDLGALFIYKVNGVVLKATDNIVLSTFLGLAIVGIYSNYLILYTAIKQLLDKIYNAIKASMGNLFATGNVQKRYDFFEVMNFLSALLYGTACIGVSVVADELVETWIGNDYMIAKPFSLLMGIEIVFVGLKVNLGQIRNVSGVFRQMWFRPLLGIVINLVVSVLMVRRLGIYGVLIGTIVADFTTCFMVDPSVIYKYSFEGKYSVGSYYIKIAKYAMILIATGVIDSLLCTHILTGKGWLSVFCHAFICGISVPITFSAVFHNSNEFQYLWTKSVHLLKRKIK